MRLYCPNCITDKAGRVIRKCIVCSILLLAPIPSHHADNHEPEPTGPQQVRTITIASSTVTLSGDMRTLIYRTPGYDPGKI
jgi:hypothetical protein